MTRRAHLGAALSDISVLGVLTIVAYGACEYAYGVMLGPIGASTHWSPASLGAIFSAVLLLNGIGGVAAGRALDRVGSRPLFALAATVGAAAMALSSLQHTWVLFAVAYGGGCGLVGALGYYHITQSVVARGSASPARAIIVLTLFGVFASPIYQPLTAWLTLSFGWRGTIRVESASVAIVFGLAALLARDRGQTTAARTKPIAQVFSGAWQNRAMRTWLLATLPGSAAVDVFLVYQVPALARAGLSLGIAASVAGFRGIAQLAGRLPLGAVLNRVGTQRAIVSAYLLAASATLLLLASGALVVAILASVLAGTAFGAISSLQGIYTTELVDHRDLGVLLGAQQAAYGVGGAIGPVAAGALLGTTHSYLPIILGVDASFIIAASMLLVRVERCCGSFTVALRRAATAPGRV